VTNPLVLAVDAGNTKTIALVADGAGRLSGVGHGPGGDIYAVGPKRAQQAVATAVAGALSSAGAGTGDVAAAAFNLAGVDWPEDRVWWETAARRLLPSALLAVHNDGLALLRVTAADGVGVAATVGTGPAVAARSAGGREWAMGFWCQHPLAAYGLGLAALRAIYLAEVGLGEPTALRQVVLDHYRQGSVEALLHARTRRGSHQAGLGDTGDMAPLVVQAAAAGDQVAGAIVDQDTQLLAGYLRAAAAQVGFGEEAPTRVTLGGPVVTDPAGLYRERLLGAIGRSWPAATPTVTAVPPVLGTLVDAFHLLEPGLAETLRPVIVAHRLPDTEPEGGLDT
jgi:N-acetylglucosamine kinase-like BadF-type ATPase